MVIVRYTNTLTYLLTYLLTKPAAVAAAVDIYGTDGRTTGRRDTRPLHRPCFVQKQAGIICASFF